MEQNVTKKSKCPICKKESVEKYRPFCSDRCKKVDLHRWIEGVYKIETDDTSEHKEDKED
jgi:endogenous inhibitor of DNA gyrase (YacG/DUF329 family)